MTWVKRLIRPLVPDRLMARFRLHQHSRQVRSNVDVVVPDEGLARRWLSTTPDTYRVMVRDLADSSGATGPVVVVGDDPSAERLARAALAIDPEAAAAVVARVGRPRLAGRLRTEPPVEPLLVAIRQDKAAAIPVSEDPIATLHHVRSAGLRYALVPRPGVVDSHRRDPIDRRVVVILAAVPIHDVGGGSRGAQLALELVRQGFHVVYVSMFGTNESVDLGLRFVHPHLEQYRLHEFDARRLGSRVDGAGVVLVEIPAEPFMPIVETLRTAGWVSVYDVIDLWSDRALGGEWYRPATEQALVRQADVVIASAADLLRGPAGQRTDAVLVPNGVNAGLFGAGPGVEPPDLPPGDGPILGYHGSLYGDWFDWSAVVDVAGRFPEARVVLIGDVPARRPDLPGNVSLLGLKPQENLPAYVMRFDVGLLPFTVTETTHAVSPLKVFEYLACGVPVAAPPLRALQGLPVHTADRLADAVAVAMASNRPDRSAALAKHSWSRRVGSLLAAVGMAPGKTGSSVETVRRAPIHHPRTERLIP